MDARRYLRIPIHFTVECEYRGENRSLQALNISRGGLLASGPEILAVGSLVKLRFAMGEAGRIELKGIVRHATDEKGCGVEFIEILPHQQAQLQTYLELVSTPQNAPGVEPEE